MSAPGSVVQIVTRLPPAIDGVGDFSLALARQMRADHGIDTCFVVGHPEWREVEEVDGGRVFYPQRHTPHALSALLTELVPTAGTVILHYVGYGYERNGCPFWLLRGLTEWRQAGPGRRLLTLFHELHAFGPPWTRAFWVSPWQRRIVIRLAEISDKVRTSTQWFVDYLERHVPHLRQCVTRAPVFSNLGEPETNIPFARRKPQMVVFGSRQWRSAAFAQHGQQLQEACRRLDIEEIVDIGVPLGFRPRVGLPVRSTGVIAVAEGTQILAHARAGFVAYWPHVLGKSGIFAAYAAHGLIPVLPAVPKSRVGDDVISGIHYLWSDAPMLSQPAALARMSTCLVDWYSSHSRAHHAEACARFVRGQSSVDQTASMSRAMPTRPSGSSD